VAEFALHCLDTRQTGRGLVVFLWFLLGGLLGAAGPYGLAPLPLAGLASNASFAVNQQAANWFRQWTFALVVVAIIWLGSLAVLRGPAQYRPEWEQRWRRVGQRRNRLLQRATP
jgi:hypothetical protein